MSKFTKMAHKSKSNFKFQGSKMLYSTALLAALFHPALAQDLSEDAKRLESVNISASKFKSNLADISTQIDILNEKELENTQVLTLSDIQKLSSSVSFMPQSTPTFTSIAIRGINTANYYNPSLTLYIDGVPQNFASFNQSLYAPSSIEILKGPQGTVYGSGAQSGVINITTKSPLDGDFASISGSASKLFYNGSVLAGGKIADSYYAKFNFGYTKNNGFIKSVSGKKTNGADNFGGNLAFIYANSNSPLIATLGFNFNKEKDKNAGLWLTSKELEDKRLSAPKKAPAKSDRKNYGTHLKLEYFLENATLSSISTYNYNDAIESYMPVNFYGYKTEGKQFTQEFRLSNEYLNDAKSVIGLLANINDKSLGTDYTYYTPLGMNFDAKTKDRQAALFANVYTPLVSNFDLEAGFRYEYAHAKGDFNAANPANSYKGATRDFNYFDYKLSLGYKFNDANRIYLLHSTATKPGGFSLLPNYNVEKEGFDKEKTYNYELGLHSSLNDFLSLNTAIFYMDVRDYQAYTTSDPATTYLTNVAKVSSKGFEANLNYNFSKFKGNLSFTYADTKIKDNPGYNKLVNAPKFVVASYGEYEIYQGFGAKTFLGASARYTSKLYQNMNVSETYYQKGYFLADAYARAEFKNGLELQAFVQNLTDTKYALYKTRGAYYGVNGILSTPGNPLNFGLRMKYNFK